MKKFFRKFTFILLLVTLSVSALSPTIALAVFLRDYFNITPEDEGDASWGIYYSGQTWKATDSYTIDYVKIRHQKSGSPSGNSEIQLRTTSGGVPTTTILASANITNASISAGSAWYTYDFVPNISVTRDVTYAWVHRSDGSSGNYPILRGNIGNSYANGGAYNSVNSGVAWSVDSPATDKYFEIYALESGLSAPSITTRDVSAGQGFMYLSGYINPNGTNVTSYGYQFGTSPSSYSANRTSSVNMSQSQVVGWIELVGQNSPYNFAIGQTYYYRVFAVNSEGTTYGNEVSFVFQPTGVIFTEITNVDFWQQSSNNNWNVSFDVATLPNTSTKITPHLGNTVGGNEFDSSLTFYNVKAFENIIANFSYKTTTFPLSNNTTYYIYAVVEVAGSANTSTPVVSFTTFDATRLTPVVKIIKLQGYTHYGKWNDSSDDKPMIDIRASITDNRTKPIIRNGFTMSKGITPDKHNLLTPIYDYPVETATGYFGIFEVTFDFSKASWWSTNDIIFIQAWAENENGRGYSPIMQVIAGSGSPTDGTTPPDTDITVIGQATSLLENVKYALRLTGTMGTWAFLLILIVAEILILETFILASKDDTVKKNLSYVLLFTVVLTIGGFVFSGQLGVMPIVILAGGTIVVLFIVGSKLLSGDRGGL